MINIIVACSENGVIGVDNHLPWHLPRDLAWFKQHTLNQVVIMGRKTFEGIVEVLGKPLPKRVNVVLSHSVSQTYENDGVVWCKDLPQAIKKFEPSSQEIFIIGGGSVYEQALPLVDRIYLTQVQTKIAGDAFFPPLDLTQWQEVFCQEHGVDEKNPYALKFLILERINP